MPTNKKQAEDLKPGFDTEMAAIYSRAKEECGYNATRFLQMLSEHGGLKTAKILVGADNVSEGYTALWEFKRLDLTVEALVIRQPWSELFSTDELETAHSRLAQYGYDAADTTP